MFDLPDYSALLRKFVFEYTGARQRTVRLAPDVFAFYAKLMIDDRLPRSARAMVTSVLAYFVVPDDVLPEADLGPMGLMDDLYAAAYAYRILRRELPGEVVADAWTADEPIEEAFSQIYSDTRAELGKRSKDVLRMAGL